MKNMESKSSEEILRYALEKYGSKVALASSFSSEDVVLIDMIVKIVQGSKSNVPLPRFFTLDTGRLPDQTYELMDKIRDKYKIKLEVYYPDTKSVEELATKEGFNLFYRSVELRQLCCRVRKVEPLARALQGLSAWICGLRKEQSITRREIKTIEIDELHNSIVKINPLATWTNKQVWDYIKEHNVPYNVLHDKGYPSIGCAPCTRPVKRGEDIRAGRWWWEKPEKKECGLHWNKQ